ncbi:MAG: cell division protein FtsA [Bacteroidetes bacterium]|nr:cell division protein FtsA [Bacteroidota bacterium]
MSKKEQPIIVGLDIGTTKVVAIAARKNEYGKLEILGVGRADSAGVNHGVVMNIEQCIRSIEQAIYKCIESNPELVVKEVYVGIAGQHIKSLQTRGDRVRVSMEEEISQKDIDLLVADQRQTYIPAGDEIIDIVPQDFTVDSTTSVIDPIGMSGVKIGANFHIITGDRNAIKNIKRCVDKAQLMTRDIVLQPLASAAAVMNDEDLEAGVAIVDIGGGTTDMAVFYDGILKHTAVIPYAGVNITNDIRNGLGVLRAQAEQMKVQFGMALADEANSNAYITIPGLRGLPPKEISMKNLAHIIQARMQEILDYVLYHLKQLGLENKLYGGIILTGGGAQLKHIIQLTEYVTGLGARIGYPNEHLTGKLSEELMNPMYSTCIGLILRGYHDYESGKMAFVGKGGNYMPFTTTVVEEKVEVIQMEEQEEGAEEKQENGRAKRGATLTQLFDGLKGKFMKLFEDVEDQEIL